MIDKVVVGFEDAVGEPIVPYELPDILHGVEFRAFRRERDDGDVLGHNETRRHVPAGLVDQEYGVSPGATALAISMRCRFIASVLQAGMTRAAPLPCFGQTAP